MAQMATSTIDKLPTATVQPQQIGLVTSVSKTTNAKGKPTTITVEETKVKPTTLTVKESKVKPTTTTVEESKVKPTTLTVKESKVKPTTTTVEESKIKSTSKAIKENQWTQDIDNKVSRGDGTGTKVLAVLIIVLKYCVLGQLIAAVGLQIQSLFNSTWGYDDYLYFTYEGRIYHSLWGFYEVGDPSLFSVHKEGNWQDWKKPIIKFQCIAMALGIAGTLIQAILLALTFVHPHKAVQIALLVAVTVLAGGSGGLVVKTVLDFKLTRPFLGFGANAIYPQTILKTVTQEGYTQAFASGAVYLVAALLSLVLVVLTAVRRAKEPTSVTPITTMPQTTVIPPGRSTRM